MYTTKVKIIFLTLFLTTFICGCSRNVRNKILDKKIGQMLIIGFDGTELKAKSLIVSDIKNNRIGGVILFDYNFRTKKFDKNIKNPKQLEKLTAELQSYAANSPLFIAVDYEGGVVNRLKAKYGFPEIYSAARLGELPMLQTFVQAKTMAETLRQNNINLDFAPVLDLNVNPDNPIIGKIGRSFSKDPISVAEHAAILSSAFQHDHILCVYKHFPGHGSSTKDSHKGFVDVSRTWSKIELMPYRDLVKEEYACDFVMTAHIVNRKLDPSGLPATLSHKMLTGVLRKQLGFRGIIVSDDMQMKAITNNYTLKKALKLGINAGVDMFIFGNQLRYDPHIAQKVIRIIEQLVAGGEVSAEKIDRAYQKIMAVKNRLKVN